MRLSLTLSIICLFLTASACSSGAGEFWRLGEEGWSAHCTPPACPEPLVINAPVDVRLATSVLYPGQYRGGDYKTHGGFRFDNHATNDVTVTAVMDAYVWRAARYPEDGEIQYYILFINDCGIMYRLDHLLTLSPELTAVFEKFPEPVEGDSSTTDVIPRVYVKKGRCSGNGNWPQSL